MNGEKIKSMRMVRDSLRAMVGSTTSVAACQALCAFEEQWGDYLDAGSSSASMPRPPKWEARGPSSDEMLDGIQKAREYFAAVAAERNAFAMRRAISDADPERALQLVARLVELLESSGLPTVDSASFYKATMEEFADVVRAAAAYTASCNGVVEKWMPQWNEEAP